MMCVTHDSSCTLQALRDGKVKSMDAVDIVPGDVLIVRLGDIVPADVKILGDEGDEDQVPMQVGPSQPVGWNTGR